MGENPPPWEIRRVIEAKEFMRGWDWESIYRVWDSRIKDFAVPMEPLFTEVVVHDPAHPTGRSQHLTWCPADSILEYQVRLQRHFDSHPGTYGPVNDYVSRKGERETLSFLWEHMDNRSKIAAILISASLFYRMGSSRKNYPKTWPPYYCVERLAQLVLGQWRDNQFTSPWHYSCTEVLPVSSYDWDYEIKTVDGLIRFLAEEHAENLLRYRLVVITFKPQRDPFVEQRLVREYEEDAARMRQWQEERERKERIEREALEKKKQAHPRYGEWDRVSKEELETLVWSMPTQKVAAFFGVSDSAVGKRCKSWGISKPPRGFWAKVSAGRIPHPDGKPVEIKK